MPGFCIFYIETNEKDFEREKAMADGEYSLSYLETLAVYRKIVTRLVFPIYCWFTALP